MLNYASVVHTPNKSNLVLLSTLKNLLVEIFSLAYALKFCISKVVVFSIDSLFLLEEIFHKFLPNLRFCYISRYLEKLLNVQYE